MIAVKGYAAKHAHAHLGPYSFERREVGAHDVLIDIRYCGVCHSDLHQVRDEWGGSIFPLVPGHEIVGTVSKVGSAVTKFKAGDLAAVGVFVDSCRKCDNCKKGMEQYCEQGMIGTYNAYEYDGKTLTYGGYSSSIVTDEAYTYKISNNLPLDRVAPLLCAGITTWSPIRHWQVSKGQRVGVMGLGGLGHMAVKLAASLGAEVTVLSTSASKKADASKLGAHDFVVTTNDDDMKKYRKHFDFIVDCVSAPHDISRFLKLLRTDGTIALVGLPPESVPVDPFALIDGRRSLAGSMIGGLKETQDMLDYCAEKKIVSDVEVIPIQQINEAYERMLKGDVRYRFVIDMATIDN